MRVVIPAEAIVTHDSGSPRDQLLPFYVAKKPRGYLGWGKSHQLGTGLGLAIGAKVARARQVLRQLHGRRRVRHDRARFRDRGALRHPDHDDRAQQLDDGDRDARDGAVAREAPDARSRRQLRQLARDLGGWSERVDDPGEVADAILRARRVNENGRAACSNSSPARSPPSRTAAARPSRAGPNPWTLSPRAGRGRSGSLPLECGEG